jgi:regulator of cell morphogenesis and NO signaling
MPPLSFKDVSFWLSQSLYQRFDIYGIDFESSSQFSDDLKTLLINIYSTEDGTPDFSKIRASRFPELIHFLSISHQYYLNKLIPEIEQSIHSYILKTKAQQSIWREVSLFFNDYKVLLIEHIKHEEERVFPVLKKSFELFEQNNFREAKAHYLSLGTENHENVEEQLAEIIEIIKKYEDQNYSGMELSVFLSQISRFEHELRNHALIEDLLMIPLAEKIFLK